MYLCIYVCISLSLYVSISLLSVHTIAIKQDSQAFFLQAKAVRKNKYSTVKSALWQSQHQTIGRRYNTQQPALRQDAYSIAISDYE